MNMVILCGNLTADPELRQGASGVNYTQFTVAVQRSNLEKDGTRKADFIPTTAFGTNAINICKYFNKGSKILLQGEWRTDSYEQNGVRVYTHKFIVTRFFFTGGGSSNNNVNANQSLGVSYQQAQQNAQIRQDFEVPTITDVPQEDFGFSTEDDFGF